jgi:hypothetical protein
MAMTNPRYRPWFTRLHFLVRLVGLAALLVGVAALVNAGIEGLFQTDSGRSLEAGWERTRDVLQGQEVEASLGKSIWLFVGAGAVVLLVLLLELVGIIRLASGRRSVAGVNFAVQVVLAAVLLIGLNWFGFERYHRIDCTRPDEQTGQKAFTLPERIIDQIARLRGETTIVILQRRPKVGGEDSSEDYSVASEAVVVGKVRDLADELRLAGAKKLKIILLDARTREFRGEFSKLTENKPKLAEAIETAAGNSIIFYTSPGEGDQSLSYVQRIGFDDFRQLDLTLSKKADEGKGNLVLLDKGVDPTIRHIFNLEEKKPRVAVLSVHEAFDTESRAPIWTLAGLKKVLVRNGFEVRDVILKRNHRSPDPRSGVWEADPAVSVLEENKYQNQKRRRDTIPIVIKRLEAGIKFDRERLKEWETAKAADLKEQARNIGFPGTGEELRKMQVTNWTSRIEAKERDRDSLKEELDKITHDLASISDDVIEQQAKETDLAAKMSRILADCDLVVVHRPPIWPYGYNDNGSLQRLDDFQVRVLRDFLKSGKPILACLSPVVTQPRIPALPGTPPETATGPDNFEQLLSELHIQLGKHALVYPTQTVEKGSDPFQAEEREVPVLDFRSELKPEGHSASEGPRLGLPSFLGKTPEDDNPLRKALALTGRAWGGELDLRYRFPRAVYYLPPQRKKEKPLPNSPEFLWTQATAYPTEDPENISRYVPREKLPTEDARDDMRQRAYPIGVAVDAEIPADWRGIGERSARKARVAVIGTGQAFTDLELPGPRAKLLLDTCNWLLGREDLLGIKGPGTEKPRESESTLMPDLPTWEYPRLSRLDKAEKERWQWAMGLGLPMLFASLGIGVLLSRRVR